MKTNFKKALILAREAFLDDVSNGDYLGVYAFSTNPDELYITTRLNSEYDKYNGICVNNGVLIGSAPITNTLGAALIALGRAFSNNRGKIIYFDACLFRYSDNMPTTENTADMLVTIRNTAERFYEYYVINDSVKQSSKNRRQYGKRKVIHRLECTIS